MPSVHREPGGSTLADLEAMPGDDGRRYELIDGNIIVSPWPAHYGGISFHLGPILAQAVPAEHASYRLCGLDLPGAQRVIPDLVVAPHIFTGCALEFEERDSGTVRIEVPKRVGHDDVAMALMLAVAVGDVASRSSGGALTPPKGDDLPAHPYGETGSYTGRRSDTRPGT